MNLVKFAGPVPEVSLDQSALCVRDATVYQAQQVTAVTTPAEESMAVAAGQELKKLLAAAEGARKEVKAPVLDLGAAIDRAKKEYAAPIEAELERLGKLMARWRETERKRVEDEEKRRKEQVEAAEAERVRRETAARELEQKALDAEASGKTEDSARLLELAVQADSAAALARESADVTICAPLPEIRRSAGSVARKQTVLEVEDVQLLYMARPELVELVPKVGAIKAAWQDGGKAAIPGCKLWEEEVVGFSRRG